MRQGSQLETLKQRIAESARKAGLDEELEVDKNIWVRLRSFCCPYRNVTDNIFFIFVRCKQRAPPPNAEWWDTALLPNKTYDDISLELSQLNIIKSDSPITIYIQHPIPIPAPGDKNKVVLKPLMLTKKVCISIIDGVRGNCLLVGCA